MVLLDTVPDSVWVLVVVLAAATGFGLWRRVRDGSVRRVEEHAADRLGPDDIGAPLGERATLLQLSSAFCAPCRTTRVVLADVARRTDGVAHVELDAEARLDLVRRLGVLRTPTTLVLDRDGRELLRAAGVPRRADVAAALSALVQHAGVESQNADRP